MSCVLSESHALLMGRTTHPTVLVLNWEKNEPKTSVLEKLEKKIFKKLQRLYRPQQMSQDRELTCHLLFLTSKSCCLAINFDNYDL